MSKSLRKTIILRSKLKNKCNKNRTGENWDSHKKQRNFCVSLLRDTKNNYFNDLNIKNTTDNKAFWKTLKSYLSKKERPKLQISISIRKK